MNYVEKAQDGGRPKQMKIRDVPKESRKEMYLHVVAVNNTIEIIKWESKPIFCKARPVPLAYKKKIEEQLENMIKDDIIVLTPVSDWGTPIVPVLKNDNTIRICGDYKT
ncbi:hypothetical protein JTB14_018870 [Gonioctena quinquepunctata]|nr:hypothetical protein JTB14_018870 [Gonioctena quinquepunctata]